MPDFPALLTTSVRELHEDSAILEIMHNPVAQDYAVYHTGKLISVPYNNIHGIQIRQDVLLHMGFARSLEKGWSLMYPFCEMILLYRHDKRRLYPSFRFQRYGYRSFTRIECRYIHSLQGIMRFLTGGELEFTFHQEDGK